MDAQKLLDAVMVWKAAKKELAACVGPNITQFVADDRATKLATARAQDVEAAEGRLYKIIGKNAIRFVAGDKQRVMVRGKNGRVNLFSVVAEVKED